MLERERYLRAREHTNVRIKVTFSASHWTINNGNARFCNTSRSNSNNNNNYGIGTNGENFTIPFSNAHIGVRFYYYFHDYTCTHATHHTEISVQETRKNTIVIVKCWTKWPYVIWIFEQTKPVGLRVEAKISSYALTPPFFCLCDSTVRFCFFTFRLKYMLLSIIGLLRYWSRRGVRIHLILCRWVWSECYDRILCVGRIKIGPCSRASECISMLPCKFKAIWEKYWIKRFSVVSCT